MNHCGKSSYKIFKITRNSGERYDAVLQAAGTVLIHTQIEVEFDFYGFQTEAVIRRPFGITSP